MSKRLELRRESYARQGEMVLALAQHFGVTMSEATRQSIRQLFEVIEVVDRHLDDCRATPDHVKELLRREELLESGEPMDDELQNVLSCWRKQVFELGILPQCLDCVDGIMDIQSSKKTTQSVGEYAQLASREGALTAELVLMVMGETSRRFSDFFREAGSIGNILDDIIDVRADVSNGETRLAPSLSFYSKMIAAVVPRLLHLLPKVPVSLFSFSIYQAMRVGWKLMRSAFTGPRF